MKRSFATTVALPIILLTLLLHGCALHRTPVFQQIHPGVRPGMTLAEFQATVGPSFVSEYKTYVDDSTYLIFIRRLYYNTPTGARMLRYEFIRTEFQNDLLVDARYGKQLIPVRD